MKTNLPTGAFQINCYGQILLASAVIAKLKEIYGEGSGWLSNHQFAKEFKDAFSGPYVHFNPSNKHCGSGLFLSHYDNLTLEEFFTKAAPVKEQKFLVIRNKAGDVVAQYQTDKYTVSTELQPV